MVSELCSAMAASSVGRIAVPILLQNTWPACNIAASLLSKSCILSVPGTSFRVGGGVSLSRAGPDHPGDLKWATCQR